MKKLGMVALMLGLALGPSVEASAKGAAGEKSKELMSRLNVIKSEAAKGNLSADRKTELRKEVKNIKKEIKQRDPVLIISLSAALLIALILVLLAD